LNDKEKIAPLVRAAKIFAGDNAIVADIQRLGFQECYADTKPASYLSRRWVATAHY
jgi:hypothetical protein